MKNIHVLPTDKPSRLHNKNGELGNYPSTKLYIEDFKGNQHNSFHIYITSDEEIKEGNWCYNSINNNVYKKEINKLSFAYEYKIILTTDQDLINDGVQKIDDDFLQWFVKNPSCEEVEVGIWSNLAKDGYLYHIIIPKEEQKQHLIDIMRGDEELGLYEEPKQETLEEAAERLFPEEKYPTEFKTLRKAFISNAKWQQERMCSEEEIIQLIQFLSMSEEFNEYGSVSKETANYFMRQFKNK